MSNELGVCGSLSLTLQQFVVMAGYRHFQVQARELTQMSPAHRIASHHIASQNIHHVKCHMESKIIANSMGWKGCRRDAPGFRLLCAKNRAHLEDPVQVSRECHLLVELRRLC
jgi:hypothetical protein